MQIHTWGTNETTEACTAAEDGGVKQRAMHCLLSALINIHSF